jgi:hypothetical protein
MNKVASIACTINGCVLNVAIATKGRLKIFSDGLYISQTI